MTKKNKIGWLERFIGLDFNIPKKDRAYLRERKEIYENCDRTCLIRTLLCNELAFLGNEYEIKRLKRQNAKLRKKINKLNKEKDVHIYNDTQEAKEK